ncbi:MAG: hypothetical protein HY875_17245 [Chloroflexi bacterium]|nr:hypothetical protein [Chloroflexota bacterium]
MSGPISAPAPPTPLRHGVVVVHGQGSHEPGEFLASVVNPIANVLEEAGGTVDRGFSIVDGKARARLVVTPPASAGTATEEFEFAEGYWANSFLPPSADEVARWILKRGPREMVAMRRDWVGNPANDLWEPGDLAREPGKHPRSPGDDVKSPAVERHLAAKNLVRAVHGQPEPEPTYRAPWLVRWAYRLQLSLVLALLPLLRAFTWVFARFIYLLYLLGGTKGTGLFSYIRKAAEFVAKLNPFLRDTLGDTERFIEGGVWAVAMRAPVEDAIIAFYADPTIADITVIAHSAGCAVTYESLGLGGRVGDAAAAATPRPKRLTLVTLGSAINRDFGFAAESKASRHARRLAGTPLDDRITGVPPDRWGDVVPAETLEEMTRLRSHFYWVDIHARMDFVPAGPLRAGAIQMARVDPCQLKLRRVINDDDLLDDHFAYFTNTDIVVPRLIRAIYGGEYPWQGRTSAETAAITRDRLAHRTLRVLSLDLVRLGLVVAVAVVSVLLAKWGGFQEGVSLVFTAGTDKDLSGAVTLPATFAFVATAFRPVYGFVREWWFGSL